jgi:hypothetical protein
MAVRRVPAPLSHYPLKVYPTPARYNLNPYPNRNGSGAYKWPPVAPGTKARLHIEVTDATPGLFDGFAFLLDYPLETGGVGTQGYTFDDDAAPPTTDGTIKIQGLGTEAAIAAQIILGVNLQTLSTPSAGFRAYADPLNTSALYIEQNHAGPFGNQAAFFGAEFNGILKVNSTPMEAEITEYLFEGGSDFLPGIIGPRRVLFPRNSVYVPPVEA